MVKLDLNIQLSKRGRDLVNRDPYGKVEPGQQKVTKLNHAERAVSFLQTNIGWSPANKVLGAVIANPIAMGIVGAIAGRVGARAIATVAAGTVLGSFAATPVAVIGASLAGGVFAASLFAKIRARKEIKQDRGMIARDRALGRTPGGPRATEMQKHIHEMESAEKIIADLQKITGDETDPQARAAALNVLADVRARHEIRLQYAKDTIRVSAEEGEKSLSLGNAMDAIKREFKRLEPKIGDEWIDPAFVTLVDDKKNKILAEIKRTDETFAEYLGKESDKKVIISAVGALGAGATLGWLLHTEMVQSSAIVSGLKAAGRTVDGVADDAFAATKRLFSFMGMGGTASTAAPYNGLTEFIDHPVGSKSIPFAKGSIQLPDNRFLVNDGNGNAHIVTAFGRVVSPTFHINPDGTLVEPSGTGEWGKLFNHSEISVPGTNFSSYLESHDFVNRTTTINFELPKGLNIFEDPITHTFDIKDSAGKIIERGLEIGPDGKLMPGSVIILQKHGWNISDPGFVTTKTEALDKTGVTKFLREHYGQSKAHRLDWHGNGTPMHKVGGHWKTTLFEDGKEITTIDNLKVKPENAPGWVAKHVGGRWAGADGKELQLELTGDDNHRILSFKKGILQSIRGAHNLDGSVDDKFGDFGSKTQGKDFKEVTKNMFLQIFTGDDYNGSGNSIRVPLDENGEFDADKYPGLRGIIYGPKGDLKATVEVVIPESDGSGYHTLATAVRHGDGAGVVEHQASYLKLSHPPTGSVNHVYSFIEPKGAPLPVAQIDEIPFIFPLPWFPRRAMEIPTLNKDDKMTARRIPQKPMGQPAFKANKELSRALVRENAFDDVMIRDAQRRRRIPNEALNESGDPAMQDALTLYALSNGIKLNKSNQKFLLDELDDSRIAEESRPLVWNKPFTFEMMKKDKNNPSGNIGMKDSLGTLVSIKDFEQRLAFAVPRPKKIYVAISESTLSKVVFDEEQVRNIFGPVIAEKLKVYGVALEFVSDADAAATRGPKPRGKGKK
jgi:hypothetical protein